MGVYEKNIVPIKISRLAEYVSIRKRISLDNALLYIYSNPMYKAMYNEKSKWWYMSTEALYREFEIARHAQTKKISIPAFEFYTYIMEMFAISRGIWGLQAYSIFKDYHVDKFLIDNYDLLHTQGTEYVIDEIERLIKRKREKG